MTYIPTPGPLEGERYEPSNGTGVKERPILFSAPMVRAILAGTKTQTRRAVKPQPQAEHGGEPYWHIGGYRAWHYRATQDVLRKGGNPLPCPYGQPGDRLWVRENGWQRPERTPKMMREGADTWAPYYFDADGISEQEAADFKAWGFKRRPSIHMPRTFSRILLEVTSVRVQRLHDVSEADCVAEGAPGGHGSIPGYQYNATPREHYSAVWMAVNGAASWAANPWVWVVEFRKC